MATQVKMAKIQAIRALQEQRWSQRWIAGELDVDRETVAKYVRAGACIRKPAKAPIGCESKPANASIGSEPVSGAFVPVQSPPGSVVGIEASTATNSLEKGYSRSACEPYRLRNPGRQDDQAPENDQPSKEGKNDKSTRERKRPRPDPPDPPSAE